MGVKRVSVSRGEHENVMQEEVMLIYIQQVCKIHTLVN
jgi:hypothetical protein